MSMLPSQRSDEPGTGATLTPVQCRMARAAARISREEFAGVAGVAVDSVAVFELEGIGSPEMRRRLRRGLEELGVKFIAAGEASSCGWPGVRMRK